MANPNPDTSGLVNHEGSPNEARKNGRKGGVASGKSRRKRKTLRDELSALLSVAGSDGRTANERISIRLIAAALRGNVKAFEVIRDTIGEKPVERMEVVEAAKIVNDIAEAP